MMQVQIIETNITLEVTESEVFSRVNQNDNQWGNNKKLNPKDGNGKISHCMVCGSIYHWARECPNSLHSTIY